MKPSREQVRQAVLSRPGEPITAVARDLGVHRATVYRAIGATPATPSPATLATPELADGFYEVHGGVPYLISCAPGDEFHVDDTGRLVPGRRPRSVQIGGS